MAEGVAKPTRFLRSVEFYSGIGGFHFAVKVSGFPLNVISAVDINTTANDVYRHNFKDTRLMQRNIECSGTGYLKSGRDLDEPAVPAVHQVGKQEDVKDSRTCSFLHLVRQITKMKRKPRAILVENVKGFETSESRRILTETLSECGFAYQEFLLTPTQFGIPNSRLRYYLVAQTGRFPFPVRPGEVLRQIPNQPDVGLIQPLSKYLTKEDNSCLLVPDKVLSRFAQVLDIVDSNSRHSCCFTKAYTHYAEGTGSVLHGNLQEQLDSIYEAVSRLSDNDAQVRELQRLQLRYFSPREISNLMGFPEDFSFPETINLKQRYRVLGNSLNVIVVASLIKLLDVS